LAFVPDLRVLSKSRVRDYREVEGKVEWERRGEEHLLINKEVAVAVGNRRELALNNSELHSKK
jgi:hypothetical protein